MGAQDTCRVTRTKLLRDQDEQLTKAIERLVARNEQDSRHQQQCHEDRDSAPQIDRETDPQRRPASNLVLSTSTRIPSYGHCVPFSVNHGIGRTAALCAKQRAVLFRRSPPCSRQTTGCPGVDPQRKLMHGLGVAMVDPCPWTDRLLIELFRATGWLPGVVMWCVRDRSAKGPTRQRR